MIRSSVYLCPWDGITGKHSFREIFAVFSWAPYDFGQYSMHLWIPTYRFQICIDGGYVRHPGAVLSHNYYM